MITAFAALKQSGKLEPYEYEHGELQSNEVALDVMHCGVCHSDLSMIDNTWGITQYPIVPGHEVIGRVTGIGSAVSNISIGQIVGLGWHSGYCNQCNSCLSGHQNLCLSSQPTIIGHHGGFANTVYASSNSVFPIPTGMNYEKVGPLLCGGITVFSPLLQFNIKPTDQVAVVGIGGLGHLAVQFLNKWGCEVTAFTSSPSKKTEAQSLGAHYVADSKNVTAAAKSSGPFDYIIITVNVKLDWNTYLSMLKPKGRLHFVGAVLEPLDIAAFGLISGQKSVSGTPVGSPIDIIKMLEFANRHNIEPVVEQFQLQEVNTAITKLRSGKIRHRVVLNV